ncbi:MAG: hypothetical protein M3512_10620, partial [Bacteroidota bacterium]|nr:hypothetical protein [Bacteroidota bacterium]
MPVIVLAVWTNMSIMPFFFSLITTFQVMLFPPSLSENKKSFTLKPKSEVENLHIYLNASSGKSTLKPSLSSNFVNVYTKNSKAELSSMFYSYIKSNEQFITLQLNENPNQSLSKNLSQRVFYSSASSAQPSWNVYLTPYKKMSLDLKYKLGHADIDLSGLAVSGLKVNTGSADVRIGYSAEMNQIEMD